MIVQKYLPNEYVEDIYKIDLEKLKEHGIKGIITDLDNTLIAWDQPYATEELKSWFEKVKSQGFQIVVVSNNNKERTGAFAEPLNLPFVHRAKKPFSQGYKRALQKMNLSQDEAVMVGDQLMTDIFGGNRVGLHTILVVPIVKTDGIWTRFNRMIERRLLKKMKKQGLLFWEEN